MTQPLVYQRLPTCMFVPCANTTHIDPNVGRCMVCQSEPSDAKYAPIDFDLARKEKLDVPLSFLTKEESDGLTVEGVPVATRVDKLDWGTTTYNVFRFADLKTTTKEYFHE